MRCRSQPVESQGGWSVARLGYRPAFDGIRAIAVFAVMLDHGGTRLVGGSIGVDVFFVLSGFLITSLLLEEWSLTTRIKLFEFYRRRVLRLFPALAVAVALVGVLYAVIPGLDDGWPYLPTALAVVFYSGNWVTAFASPVGQHTLGALTHTWSLAVEEQFYLLWPLILIACLQRRWSPARLVKLLVGIALCSAVWRAVLYLVALGPHGLATYIRFDTRADGLALGCAVAVAAATISGRAALNRFAGATPVALAAGAVLVFVAFETTWIDRRMYLGGFAVVNLAAAVVIAHVFANQSSLLSRSLSQRTLVWLGKRSYGLYLFHAPIFLVLSPARLGLSSVSGYATLVIDIAVTVAVAAASYRWIESYFLRKKRYGSEFQTREPVDEALQPSAVGAGTHEART